VPLFQTLLGGERVSEEKDRLGEGRPSEFRKAAQGRRGTTILVLMVATVLFLQGLYRWAGASPASIYDSALTDPEGDVAYQKTAWQIVTVPTPEGPIPVPVPKPGVPTTNAHKPNIDIVAASSAEQPARIVLSLKVAGQIQDRQQLEEGPELLPTYYFIAKTHPAREKEVGCIIVFHHWQKTYYLNTETNQSGPIQSETLDNTLKAYLPKTVIGSPEQWVFSVAAVQSTGQVTGQDEYEVEHWVDFSTGYELDPIFPEPTYPISEFV